MNKVQISYEECKGCRLCVEACPNHCLKIGKNINKIGYLHAEFDSEKCVACGICFYICPEPGAITVIKGDAEKKRADHE